MDNFWKKNCRLCLDTISSENFGKTSIVTKETLDILLLKLDIDKHVMCKVCALKVQEALKFKSMCVSTNNLIISYVGDETESAIDLLEIYTEKQGSKQLIDTLSDHKVCRLCMQLIRSEFISVHEIKRNGIENYIPEVNISVIEDPVVCKQCFESVATHSSFLKNCLEVEEKIMGYCDYSGSQTVEIIIKQENNENDDECMTSRFTLEEPLKEENEYEIKTECIDIKSEDDESEMLYRRSPTHETISEMYNCEYETKHNSSLKNHTVPLHENTRLDHEENTKVNRIHPQVLMYKCDECSYESKRKSDLKIHLLKHKDPSQVRMYKCDKCSYETRYRKYFKSHQLTHKDPSQVRMFKCNECSFATRRKSALANHRLRHKDPSQVRMYKCDTCLYETRYIRYFRTHQLKHKDPSQVRMYMCNECSFASRHMSALAHHRLNHKDPSQLRMYKCDRCSYESKLKYALKSHQLLHKDRSQVEMYKCDECSYESRNKYTLKRHQLRHKDPSQVQMYKCDKCSYESKYRQCVKIHQLKHKDRSQVQMDNTVQQV